MLIITRMEKVRNQNHKIIKFFSIPILVFGLCENRNKGFVR